MLLRDILDFFTQFMILCCCFKILQVSLFWAYVCMSAFAFMSGLVFILEEEYGA